MKDKWMNMGYEEDELRPYIEPETELNDLRRIGEYQTRLKTLKQSSLLLKDRSHQ
jgi:hypothetical protein